MFVGHYAAAYAGKAVVPRAPLWLLLIAAQAVDLLWAVLLLSGVEQAHLDHRLPSNPLVAESMPYSHSLLGGVVVALLVAALALRIWRHRGIAVAAAFVVLSHWFCDWLMHRPDLTLYGVPPKLGLGLWEFPLLAHSLEIALLLLTAAWASRQVDAPQQRGLWIVAGVLLVSQLYAALFPPPPTITLMAVTLLLSWLAYPALAAWLEQRSTRA